MSSTIEEKEIQKAITQLDEKLKKYLLAKGWFQTGDYEFYKAEIRCGAVMDSEEAFYAELEYSTIN